MAMPMAKRSAAEVSVGPPPVEKTMAAVLGLLIADRDERLGSSASPRKTESILAAAGLGIGDIAVITGKKYKAVQMAIARAKRGQNTKRIKRPSKRAS